MAQQRRWTWLAYAALLALAARATDARSARAKEAARVAAYNRAVSEWMEAGGGLSQIEDAWPEGSIKIVFSKPGPTVVKPITLTVVANDTTYNLNYEDPALKWYNGSLWFETTLPMWDQTWSNITNVGFNGGRDQFFTLTPYGVDGDALMPITGLKAFTCSEYIEQVPCQELPAPPPPGPWTHRTFALAAGGGRRLAQSDEDAADFNGTAGFSLSSSPPAKGAHLCSGYFRQINFLNSITLLTGLSGVNTSFTFSTGQCSMEYTSVVVPVPQSIYQADMSSPDGAQQMAWCSSWPVHFAPPQSQPTLYVRGANDPYVVAGDLTDCTWDFAYVAPPAARRHGGAEHAASAAPLVVLVLGTAGLFLACCLSRRTPSIDYKPLLRDDASAGYGAADDRGGERSIEVPQFRAKGA